MNKNQTEKLHEIHWLYKLERFTEITFDQWY